MLTTLSIVGLSTEEPLGQFTRPHHYRCSTLNSFNQDHGTSQLMELKLSGKSVLITGGSKGIGLATARAFAGEGCHLHLSARTLADLESARDTIAKDFAVPVTTHATDLSKRESASRLVQACGDVDILVNDADAVPGGSLEEVDERRGGAARVLKIVGYISITRE